MLQCSYCWKLLIFLFLFFLDADRLQRNTQLVFCHFLAAAPLLRALSISPLCILVPIGCKLPDDKWTPESVGGKFSESGYHWVRKMGKLLMICQVCKITQRKRVVSSVWLPLDFTVDRSSHTLTEMYKRKLKVP